MSVYNALLYFRYVQIGHVHEVVYHSIKYGCPFAFLNAEAIPSQRISQKPHHPWISVKKDAGTIYMYLHGRVYLFLNYIRYT
jgi:hypothetical protein